MAVYQDSYSGTDEEAEHEAQKDRKKSRKNPSEHFEQDEEEGNEEAQEIASKSLGSRPTRKSHDGKGKKRKHSSEYKKKHDKDHAPPAKRKRGGIKIDTGSNCLSPI